jgi:hypothetical protein
MRVGRAHGLPCPAPRRARAPLIGNLRVRAKVYPMTSA